MFLIIYRSFGYGKFVLIEIEIFFPFRRPEYQSGRIGVVAGIPRSIVADLTFVQKFNMSVSKKNAVGIVVAVGDLCTVRIIYIPRRP